MVRRLFFFSLVICSLLISCETPDPYQGYYIELGFEEKFSFGNPDSVSKSMVFFARDVRVGPNDKIYVADAAKAKVKMYSPTGKFIRSFGKRGREPGEFTDIRGFAVTDSTVLVWDQSNQRINTFNLKGEVRTAHNIKGAPSMMRIYPLKNSYLALHIGNYHGDQIGETNLGHLYPPDFSEQKASFLKVKEIDRKIEPISQALLSWSGHVTVLNSDRFLFVPLFYNGNI